MPIRLALVRCSAFLQTDAGGWSYDIPTRSDESDDTPDGEGKAMDEEPEREEDS